MKTVTLHNKTFEVFISDTEIAEIVHSIANAINNSGIKNPLLTHVLSPILNIYWKLIRNFI